MRKNGRKNLKRIGAGQYINEAITCINHLQKTPFRINQNVLEVLDTVWSNNVPINGLVSREDIEQIPYPFDVAPDDMTAEQRRELKIWKGKRAAIYQANARNMSKRLQIERTIQVAKDYDRYDQFYYTWQYDFRGRAYAVSDFLHPQTADYGKALLEFAGGVKIQQEHEAKWLAIHGANVFGEDKISLSERENWAYDHFDDVVKTVEKPFDFTWWMTADKPFQFLAFCCEWFQYIKALENGEEYLTHLPVSADGSCNGLQHLSAILRDEQGGKAVNLLPADKPNDIYYDVAMQTQKLVEIDAAKGDELAKQILAFGIDRKLTKRSVMIVPYAGTRFACREYIAEALQDRIDKGEVAQWEDTWQASQYLCGHVWDSIGTVISSARQVMDFVKDIGKAYADKQVPMEWRTPTGFLVIQDYPDLMTKRIKTHIDGNIVKVNFMKPIDNTVCRGKTISSSSPNFIHSLDASALVRTVNKCADEGMWQFSMVHDSYGTHSPNLPLMQEILRKEFVKMYEENDVLEELRDHAITTLGHDDLPVVPTRGNLDLRQVINSDYFFA